MNRGLATGDVVSVLSPNTNALLEAHFGVPLAGGVLNALNTRLEQSPSWRTSPVTQALAS